MEGGRRKTSATAVPSSLTNIPPGFHLAHTISPVDLTQDLTQFLQEVDLHYSRSQGFPLPNISLGGILCIIVPQFCIKTSSNLFEHGIGFLKAGPFLISATPTILSTISELSAKLMIMKPDST